MQPYEYCPPDGVAGLPCQRVADEVVGAAGDAGDAGSWLARTVDAGGKLGVGAAGVGAVDAGGRLGMGTAGVAAVDAGRAVGLSDEGGQR